MTANLDVELLERDQDLDLGSFHNSPVDLGLRLTLDKVSNKETFLAHT